MAIGKKKKRNKRVRFSDYFKLAKSQVELDFVDIPIKGDIALFVDPASFAFESDPWYVVCNNLVIDFFEKTIQAIQEGNTKLATHLLSHLHEPDETHLGYSKPESSGRGLGKKQIKQLQARLEGSKAVRTGRLSELSDAELIIPGISHDKISDIALNVIRGPLIKYTESQCILHNIPTSKVGAGMIWDDETGTWRSVYANLPIVHGEPVVLVPRAAVRFRLAADHREYYQHYVLPFLQDRHLDSNSALVRVLKSGKRRVYKKDVKKEYPLSKEFLFDFSEEHPEVLKQYRDKIDASNTEIQPGIIEASRSDSRPIDFDQMAHQLTPNSSRTQFS